MRTFHLALLGILPIAGICVALVMPLGFGPADNVSAVLAGECSAAQSALEPGVAGIDTPALVGTLAFRDHTVRVHAGPRYTVEDAEGQTLAELVSYGELEELLPDFFDGRRPLLAYDATWAGKHLPTSANWRGR